MAEIKMDISEYEEMKKNTALLEASLLREQSQNDKISALEKEKMDALKSNEKSVTVIKRTESTEMLLVKRNPREILKRMSHILGINRISRNNNFGGPERFSSFDGGYDRQHVDHYMKEIQDSFFDITTAKSMPSETITTKGLDEVKAEIKADLESKLDDDVERDLKRLAIVEVELKKSNTELLLAQHELKTALRKNDNLIRTKDNALNDNDELRNEINKIEDEFEEIDRPFNYFNAFFKLSKIKEIYRKQYGLHQESRLRSSFERKVRN